jgi:Fur family transcriptional regulator, zinc uptake regulator
MERSRRRAANYQQVYRALRAAQAPMTAYEVLDAVRPHGISAPPTVYRALNGLIEEGLAHRLETINAFVACIEPHRHHDAAIFAICSDCGSIEELFDTAILKRLHARAAERSFKVKSTTIEMRGQCTDCGPATP